MSVNRLSLIIIILFLATGCRTLHVESYPSGAIIMVDDVAQNERTPHDFFVRHFDTGAHSVTVVKNGYKTITLPQNFNIGISGGDIFWSIFVPPVFLKNLFHDHWKDVTPTDLKPFDLIADIPQANTQRTEEKFHDGQDTVSARLKQLETLRDQKLITEEEYKIKHQLLLDKL